MEQYMGVTYTPIVSQATRPPMLPDVRELSCPRAQVVDCLYPIEQWPTFLSMTWA